MMNDLTRRRRKRSRNTKRYKKRSDRVLTKKPGNLTGVCAGLGEYFGIDPVLVRVGFIAGSFFSFGTAAIAYLALAAFLPSDEPDTFGLDGRFDYHQDSIEGQTLYKDEPYVSHENGALSVCWRCDTVSKPESKFCHKCGAKL